MHNTDFWWLTSDQQMMHTSVVLGHHRPIRDDENPHSVAWEEQSCSVSEVEYWRGRFGNTNVYRSLLVEATSLDAEKLVGPFLIDIDNEGENLEDALLVARSTAQILESQFAVDPGNLRILFTGRKGFNLEVHPRAIGLAGTIDSQVKKSADCLFQIVEALRVGHSWLCINQVSDTGTVVDLIYGRKRSGYGLKHRYLRLCDSLNSWVMPDGTTRRRMKTEITLDELGQLTIREIVDKSENPAG